MSGKRPFLKYGRQHQRRLVQQENDDSTSSSNESDELAHSSFMDLPSAKQRKLVREQPEDREEEESNSSEIESSTILSQIQQSASSDVSFGVDMDSSVHSVEANDYQENPTNNEIESDSESNLDDNRYIFSDDDLDFPDDEEADEEPVGHSVLADFCMRRLKDDGTTELLKIMKSTYQISNLPTTAAELFDTPQERMPEPVDIEGGQYLDFGIRNNLKLIELSETNIPQLTLNFSWDGVRLFKSSSKCLWPLVMKVEEMKDLEVMLVGLYIGDSKPQNANEYFYCFNKECKEIAQNNMLVEVGTNRTPCKVVIGNMIADAVARHWALGKKLLNFIGNKTWTNFFCAFFGH